MQNRALPVVLAGFALSLTKAVSLSPAGCRSLFELLYHKRKNKGRNRQDQGLPGFGSCLVSRLLSTNRSALRSLPIISPATLSADKLAHLYSFCEAGRHSSPLARLVTPDAAGVTVWGLFRRVRRQTLSASIRPAMYGKIRFRKEIDTTRDVWIYSSSHQV